MSCGPFWKNSCIEGPMNDMSNDCDHGPVGNGDNGEAGGPPDTPPPHTLPPVTPPPEPTTNDGSTWGQEALRSTAGTAVAPTTPDGAPDVGASAIDASGIGAASAGVSGVGAGRSGGRRAGPRSIRPPRFSAGPLVAGLGLLSILVVIGIMALLAIKVLDGTSGTGLVDGALPGVTVDRGDPDAADGSTSGGVAQPGALDTATAAACRIDKQTIETAVSVFEAIRDEPPMAIGDLVDESLLREDPGTFELRQGADGIEVVGVGDCEGVD